jgi:hypothetical protein
MFVLAAVTAFTIVAEPSRAEAPAARPATRIPLIDVTDLYHPHQDVGDNFDLVAAFALPEVDLKAVILDCTEPFRQPVAKNPGPGLWPDNLGPREPGFIPVLQLNYIYNRNVPCGVGPFTRMKSPGDKMLDAPGFQQQGVELILRTLRESDCPVEIVSFGSARTIAVAYNRDPAVFHAKLRRLHLSVGASTPGFLEWNTALEPQAIVRLLRSDLPIAIYPDAAGSAKNPPFSMDEHNTFYSLTNRRFITAMAPPLRRYLEYAFSRAVRVDFLRATEIDGPPLDARILDGPHSVWETALWTCITGRRLVRRADGTARLIPPDELRPGDRVLPNECRPCTVNVRDDGIYEFHKTTRSSNFTVYYRGNPQENEAAFREALPALYRSFRVPTTVPRGK